MKLKKLFSGIIAFLLVTSLVMSSVVASTEQGTDINLGNDFTADYFVGLKDGVNSDLFIEKSGLKQKKGKKIKQDLVAGTLSSSEAEELKKPS